MFAQIPVPPIQGFDLGFTEVRIYGVLIAVAVLVAATWTRKRYESYGGSGELADRVTVWAVVIAFIGSRSAYVSARIGRFIDDPLAVFQIWEGGLALYGGLTFGLIALYVLLRRWGGNFPAFMDGLAPALPLAQAIGRWGNYFNQELYGTPTDMPWGVVIEDPIRGEAPLTTFHPTFLYESIANLILMAVILRVEKTGRLKRGSLIMVYAIGYGVIRFALELIRTDTEFRLLGLSRNGLFSLVFIAGGVLMLRWWNSKGQVSDVGLRRRKPTAKAAADEGAEPSEASAVLVSVTEGSAVPDTEHEDSGDAEQSEPTEDDSDER